MTAAAENAGIDLETALPAENEANPIDRVYSLLGRKQPSVIYLSNRAIERLSAIPACFKAVTDSLPAGALMSVDNQENMEDSVSVVTQDSCEVFVAREINDTCTIGADDASFVPRRTVL